MLETAIVAIGLQLTCLAVTVYHESRGEPLVGQLAVATTVINRVHDSRWPSTICDTVKEGPTLAWDKTKPIKHKCQFSYYCDGKSDRPTDPVAFNRAMKVAEEAWHSYGLSMDITEGSTFYHSVDVEPKWNYQYVVQIGNHIFYK
jgi:spore germination cell wall hydrolase CwlJ-like protein